MSQREITTATFWQLGSQAVMALLSVLTIKFVAMGLSRDLVGAYHSAYGYLQLFGILADFGLYAVAVREMSRTQEPGRILDIFFRMRLVTVSLMIGGAVLSAWFLPQWRGTPLPIGVTLAAFVPAFTLLAGVFRAIFQVHYRMHLVFIAEVGQRVIAVALLGLFLFLGVRESDRIIDYELFLSVGGMGAAFLFLFSFFHARKFFPQRGSVHSLPLGPFIRAALPYGVAYLCIALYRQLDVTLIALLRPDFQLQNAYYGFATRLAEMAYLVPTFLLNAALPHLKGEASDDILLQRVFFSLLLFGTVVALVSGLWATPIMQLLTADTYLRADTIPGADSALTLLALPMFLNGLILFCFYILLSTHAWRPLLITLSIGVCISLMGNLFLIPLYGFMGAGVVSIGTHVVLCTLLMFSLWNRGRFLPWTACVRWLLFAGILTLFLMMVRPLLTTPHVSLVGMVGCGVMIVFLCEILGIRKTIFWNCAVRKSEV